MSDFTSNGPVDESRDLGYVKAQWSNARYCSSIEDEVNNMLIGQE